MCCNQWTAPTRTAFLLYRAARPAFPRRGPAGPAREPTKGTQEHPNVANFNRDARAHRPRRGARSNSIIAAASHSHPTFLLFCLPAAAPRPARAPARAPAGHVRATNSAALCPPRRADAPAPRAQVGPAVHHLPTARARPPAPCARRAHSPHHPLKNSRVRFQFLSFLSNAGWFGRTGEWSKKFPLDLKFWFVAFLCSRATSSPC